MPEEVSEDACKQMRDIGCSELFCFVFLIPICHNKMTV